MDVIAAAAVRVHVLILASAYFWRRRTGRNGNDQQPVAKGLTFVEIWMTAHLFDADRVLARWLQWHAGENEPMAQPASLKPPSVREQTARGNRNGPGNRPGRCPRSGIER